MNSWTLRQQRTQTIRQGYKQEHTAALRAAQYVRRHAMEFHGAGVEDAVQDLATLHGGDSVIWPQDAAVRDLAAFSRASRNAQNGMASLIAAFRGLPVVGWKGENGCAYCPKHRPSGGIMLTTADRQQIKGLLLCLTCGTDLGTEKRPAECPDCSHAHVADQLCTVVMSSFRICGCTA